MVDVLQKKDLCIVHIGMPKTGSSSLQESLSKKIIDDNIVYANIETINHSAVIYSMFSTNPQSHALHKGLNRSKEEIEQFNSRNKLLLIEGFKNHNASIEIISGEDIFHLDIDGLYRMKSFLKEYFKEILIVGYIRSPKSFMESAFQQLVKYHEIDTFDFDLIYPHYRLKLEKFDIVFGKENVKLWKFDPKEFPNSDITEDFCNKLNIQVNTQDTIRVNDSISREAVSLLYANNKYGNIINSQEIAIEINNKLVELISPIGNEKFRFSTFLTDEVIEKHKEDIGWMQERLDNSLSEDEVDTLEDIDSEKKLLTFTNQTVEKLKNLLESKYDIQNISVNNVQNIVKIMDILKRQIAESIGVFYEGLFQKKVTQEYRVINDAKLDWSDYFQINNISDDTQDPIQHYLDNGDEGLAINYIFDASYYLARYPDIQVLEVNPLVHFLQDGQKEGRIGSQKSIEYQVVKKADLDWSNYFVINNIVNDNGLNPISHYLYNWQKGLIISDFFDTGYYLDTYPDIKNIHINPLIHFIQHGMKEGRKGIQN